MDEHLWRQLISKLMKERYEAQVQADKAQDSNTRTFYLGVAKGLDRAIAVFGGDEVY